MGLFGKSLGQILVETVIDTIKDNGSSSGGYSSSSGINVFENAEKKREAREFISQAKQYVSEGDSIYEKAYNNVMAYASETEYKLKQHAEYKQKLARELGSNVGNTLKNFSRFNIDSKVMEAPTISGSSGGMDISVFKSATSSCMPRIDTPSIFDLFASDDDYYEAKRQRDEAKRYKERMKVERERLYRYKEQMGELQSFISSERSELESLMTKVNKMTAELNSGMEKNRFTREEADYLKGIHKITEQVANLLSTQFLTDSFSITSKYQKLYDGIKQINQNLPIAPSITDRSTLDAIKRIVDGTIVY